MIDRIDIGDNNMNNKSLITIIGAITFVVFNIIFFILKPEDLNSGGWISYVFMNIAIIIFSLVPWIEANYAIPNLSVTTGTIALIYAIVAIVAGVIFIVANPESGKVAFVIHLLIIAVFAVWMILNISANKKTADNVEAEYDDHMYIERLSKKVSLLLADCKSESVKKELTRLYDEIHASPVVTAWNNADLNSQIEYRIDNMKQLILNPNVERDTIQEIQEIIIDVEKRNQQ